MPQAGGGPARLAVILAARARRRRRRRAGVGPCRTRNQLPTRNAARAPRRRRPDGQVVRPSPRSRGTHGRGTVPARGGRAAVVGGFPFRPPALEAASGSGPPAVRPCATIDRGLGGVRARDRDHAVRAGDVVRPVAGGCCGGRLGWGIERPESRDLAQATPSKAGRGRQHGVRVQAGDWRAPRPGGHAPCGRQRGQRGAAIAPAPTTSTDGTGNPQVSSIRASAAALYGGGAAQPVCAVSMSVASDFRAGVPCRRARGR